MASEKNIPEPVTSPLQKNGVHPAVYITLWIVLSSSVILYNKYILHTLEFPFPIFLTTCHLVFATIATRILHKTSNLLDGLKDIDITWDIFKSAVLPIGVFFSLSLVFSNNAYLYLTVSYIQMLKATTPVAVLLVGYALQVEKPDFLILTKVTLIVVGVIIASYGEFEFVLLGVMFQCLGIGAEATRLVLVQKLLKGYKMDPLVSLYQFAPICALMNGVACALVEGPTLTWGHISHVGLPILLSNCAVAFALNVAVVFLIGKTSCLVMCLSGILKDIILVFISTLIWNTQVTTLQTFGYGIALIGLAWYKQPNMERAHLIGAVTILSIVCGLMATGQFYTPLVASDVTKVGDGKTD